MGTDIIRRSTPVTAPSSPFQPPAIIADAGSNARFAYEEFFNAEIENDHTRRAYRKAVHRFLLHCEHEGLALQQVTPAFVGAYIRSLQTEPRCTRGAMTATRSVSKPTKKLHLSAIRHFFDKLVVRHAVVLNPAASVRGPKHSVIEGKTPALTPDQARRVLAGIDISTAVGLRDRAIIGVLVYTAARVGAVAKLKRGDYYPDGRQHCLRLDEKGGKSREIPVRHDLEGFVEEYLAAAGITHDAGDTPLFRTAVRRTRQLTGSGMTANDVFRMVRRRFAGAGLPAGRLTCHSFRATTITDLLEQGVPLEDVQYLAGHADPRTTRLYDRRRRQVTRNIVERISI